MPVTRRQFGILGLGLVASWALGACGGSDNTNGTSPTASSILDLKKARSIDHIDNPKKDIVYYSPNNVSLEDGKLILEMRNSTRKDSRAQYSSGRVEFSLDNFSKGRIDIRASLPVGTGLFPVLGLFPADDHYPPMAVIASSLGAKSQREQKYRTAYDTSNGRMNEAFIPIVGDDLTHTYSLEITDQLLIWYLDDQEVRREAKPVEFETNWKVWAILRAGNAIPGIGDPEPGALDGTQMIIEEIRVTPDLYQRL